MHKHLRQLIITIALALPLNLAAQMNDYGGANYRLFFNTQCHLGGVSPCIDSIYWHWEKPTINYWIDNRFPRYLDSTLAINALHAAFQSWEDVPSTTINFLDLGRDTNKQSYTDGKNIIFFTADKTYLADDEDIAETWITWRSLDSAMHNIIDVDIVFSDAYIYDTIAGKTAWWSIDTMLIDSIFDIQSIATHEIGHLCGLDHAPLPRYDHNCPTMAEFILWNTIDNKDDLESPKLEMQTLAPDDTMGLAYLYGKNLQSPSVFPTLETAFDFAQPPQSIVLSEGKKVPVFTNYDVLSNKHTLEAGQSLVIGKNVKLYLEDTLIVNQGAFIRMEGSESEGKDADMVFMPGSKLIIHDKYGLQGTGNIIDANILWHSNFEMGVNDSLVFWNEAALDFTTDSSHAFDIIIDGALIFKTNIGHANVYFGDSLRTIYVNGKQSRLETFHSLSLLNIPSVQVYYPSYVSCFGEDTSQCVWIFRYRAPLDVYARLVAYHTVFYGEYWDGILAAYENSSINIDHCLISGIYTNPTTLNGSALRLYGSSNETNKISNSVIFRYEGLGATKAGDGIILQPHYGNPTIIESILFVDSTCIYEDWRTGVFNAQSYLDLRNSNIFRNREGNGNTLTGTTTAYRNYIHHNVDRGIFGSFLSSILLKDYTGSTQTGDNTISDNDVNGNQAQIVIESESYLNDVADTTEQGGNTISHLQNTYSVSVSNSFAYVKGNWFGDPPTGCSGTYGTLDASQIASYFNNIGGTIICDSALCADPMLPYYNDCGEDVGEIRSTIFQNENEIIDYGNSFRKSAINGYQQGILIYALRSAWQHVRRGNMLAIYPVLGSLLANTNDSFIASIVASTALHYETAHSRLHPDSLSACMTRNAIFLRNQINATSTRDVKAALEEVLCYTYVYAGDVTSAEQEIDTLSKKYSSTKYANRILGLVQLIAMAKRDTIGVDDAISQMISNGYSDYDIMLAHEMRASFLRAKPRSVVFPKLWIPENDPPKTKDDNADTRNSLFVRNYPNPFNPSTTIEFNLPQDSHASIRVYNLLGRLVSTLKDEDMTAGIHRVEFATAPGTPTGMYLAVLTTECGVKTSVMMFAK
jgi:hypothetical protein